MQHDFSLFIQIKFSFWSHFIVFFFFFFFFGFSMCMVTFLRNHPNFQNLFVWTNTNMISALYLTLNSQKSLWICAIMHSWKKRETHPKILGAVVSCLTVMLNVLFAWNNNKNERHVMNTEKHMILSIRKAHLTRKVLWSCEPNYQQKLEQVETKIKKFCRHDQIKVVFFFLEQE